MTTSVDYTNATRRRQSPQAREGHRALPAGKNEDFAHAERCLKLPNFSSRHIGPIASRATRAPQPNWQ